MKMKALSEEHSVSQSTIMLNYDVFKLAVRPVC